MTEKVTAGYRNIADWQAIKTEYITTDTSYRKLAEKYGIDQAVIARKGYGKTAYPYKRRTNSITNRY